MGQGAKINVIGQLQIGAKLNGNEINLRAVEYCVKFIG